MRWLAVAVVCTLAGVAPAAEPLTDLATDPAAVRLSGPDARWGILVSGKGPDGRSVDLTRGAQYRVADPGVAAVSAAGVVRARTDGTTALLIEVAGRTLRVPVVVEGTAWPRHFNFENDIIPLFSRFGCNSSGCHGKSEGQNGFKLSVFGFDPAADLAALTKEGRGRRVFPAAPEHSLLLAKMSGTVPHGGGRRIARGTPEYELVRAWIAAGSPVGSPSDPRVVAVRVEPHERVLAVGEGQQLRVVARYSDGREADVTAYSRFQSNNDGLAAVAEDGQVTAGQVPGDVAVMAGYMGAVDVFRALIPRPGPPLTARAPPAYNFIDRLVDAKLRRLHITPSPPADDAEYLRRVYLDVTGTLPTPAEARRFLADARPEKRARLVDELLSRPEFADYWALRWADLLRVDREKLGHKHAYAYYKWIRDSVAADKPLDRFARELLTAEGPLGEDGPANYYKVVSQPGEAAATLSQVFLGVRIACAQCHHHPFDRWSPNDYFGMEAFFAQVAVRGGAGGEMVMAAGDPPTRNPRTGETVTAHALGMRAAASPPAGDRRRLLADWMTSAGNPWFARNLANRAWAHFLGRGLVEPVDDFRETNPPSNPELLDALAGHLVASGFEFKALVRAIAASRTYQTSSRPNATNERDELNYSRALFKRVDAEVLLDMVCQATGVGEKFPGLPAGYRAVQLWDSKVPHYFLKLFGRPERATACACERSYEPSVSQVLHLLNSPEVHAKLSDEGGTVARLVRECKDDGRLADELYLTFFSRLPTADERVVAVAYLGKRPDRRRQAAEDLAWTLLNSLEFVFNH